MTRFLGTDTLRGLGNRYRGLDNIRPWENGQRWTSSRSGGGGMPNVAAFRGLDRFESDRIEANTRKGTNPAPFVSRGHKLDANTIALWRFDDARPDNRANTFQDSTGTAWTFSGMPGICSFDPIPGAFARRFVCSHTVAGDRNFLTLATSTAIRNMLIGSYTWEGYVRLETLVGNHVLWSHLGLSSSETSPNNTIGSFFVDGTTGLMNLNWEFGAGTNEAAVQTVGAGATPNVWHYVAVVKDSVGKTVKFYVDGVLSQSVAYVNEPTDGSGGTMCIAGQEPLASAGGGADCSIRSMQWSTVVRDLPWIEESYRRMTIQGTFQRDASVLFATDFIEAPSAEDISGYGHHLTSTATSTDGTSPVFSLIPDDLGAGRSFLNCTLATWHSDVIRTAILNDFTVEVWVQIIGPVPATGNGIWHHGGNPASETQANNRHGMCIAPVLAMVAVFEHGGGLNGDGDVGTSPGSFELGRRYHIAFRKTMVGAVWTGAMFVNGVKIAESFNNINGDGSTQANQVSFQVGGGVGVLGDISKFFGFMDDFRLSNVARTDAEILEGFQRGVDSGEGPFATLVSPTAWSTIAQNAALTFTVSDSDTVVSSVDSVTVYFADGSSVVVLTSGVFAAGYTTSSISLLAGVYTLVLRRDAGWTQHITRIVVVGTDGLHNVGSSSLTGWFVNVPDEPPIVELVTPPLGVIAKDDPLVIDVADDRGLAYIAVFAKLGTASTKIPVFRRGAFEPGFQISSTIEAVTPGDGEAVRWRLHVRRNTRWPAGQVQLITDPVDDGGQLDVEV